MKDEKTTTECGHADIKKGDLVHLCHGCGTYAGPEKSGAHYLCTKCPSCGLLSCEEPYVHKDGCRLSLVGKTYLCKPHGVFKGNCALCPVEEWESLWPFKGDEQIIIATKRLLAQEREKQRKIDVERVDSLQKIVVRSPDWGHTYNQGKIDGREKALLEASKAIINPKDSEV